MLGEKLDAVLMETEEGWDGQFLQYDIGACAESLEDLLYEMQRSLVAYLAVCDHLGVDPATARDPAPRRYWDLWRKATYDVLPQEPSFRTEARLPEMHLRGLRLCA